MWKKFEVWIENARKGMLNINTPALKKALAFSMAGIISATSLTGCSFGEKVDDPAIVEVPLEFTTIEDELEAKMNFVYESLNALKDEEMRPEILSNIESLYFKAAQLNANINMDPSDEDYYTYFVFLTEEDIRDKKEQIISYLDAAIKRIESSCTYRFGEDFADFSLSVK